MTANLAHMWAFAANNPQITITQHFFAAYHGSGPSDAAASHLSRAIKNETRNYQWAGDDFDSVVARLGKISDPDTTKIIPVPIPDDLQKISPETARGIKKSHKFTFHQNWVVCGWQDSSAPAPSQAWQLSFVQHTESLL